MKALPVFLLAVMVVLSANKFVGDFGMGFLAEPIIWTCEAASDSRSYVVESLNRSASRFELRIYSAPRFERYQETVVMQIQYDSQHKLVGTGTLKSGELVYVTAFAKSGVAFQVKDNRGYAVGHCVRNVTAN